jgi:conjugative transfer pilus assembly protein TraH
MMKRWLLLLTPLLVAEDSVDRYFKDFNRERMGVHHLGAGGPIFSPAREQKEMQLQISDLPGCEGIDLITGGIAAANGQEMKRTLESISDPDLLSPSKNVYHYLLGLETVSPLITSITKQVQTWANQLNAMNLSSCERARSWTGGVQAQVHTGARYQCEQAFIREHVDPIAARKKCQGLVNKKRENLAGKAGLKDLAQTLMGTVVWEKEQIIFYPSLYQQLIGALHSGKPFQGYVGEKVERKLLSLPALNQQHILSVLQSIQRKLMQETEKTELTEEEQEMLETVATPLAEWITLVTQAKGGGSIRALERMSNLISFDRIFDFLEKTAIESYRQVKALRMTSVNSALLEEYIQQMEEVIAGLATQKEQIRQQSLAELQTIEMLRNLDRDLRERRS